MRVSDMQNITKSHIIDNCINFIPEKGDRLIKEPAVVPISKPVRDILERNNYIIPYMDKSNVQKSIRLFCSKFPLLQKEIMYIEVSGAKATETFVPKYSVLTSHAVGRKTFINLVIQKSVPIPILMGYTGHRNMDTVIKKYLHKHQNNLPHLEKVFEF
jgi:hypothetical protein